MAELLFPTVLSAVHVNRHPSGRPGCQPVLTNDARRQVGTFVLHHQMQPYRQSKTHTPSVRHEPPSRQTCPLLCTHTRRLSTTPAPGQEQGGEKEGFPSPTPSAITHGTAWRRMNSFLARGWHRPVRQRPASHPLGLPPESRLINLHVAVERIAFAKSRH